MKTILKQLLFGSILLATVAGSAVIASAQTADPCEGAAERYDEFSKLFVMTDKKSLETAIEKGKVLVSVNGSCEAQKDGIDFAKAELPKMEARLIKWNERLARTALIERFDKGMKASNWDEVYASGKEILAKYGDEFRAVELVLGTIGLDRMRDATPNPKWNDQTLQYAKQAIASIESGKTFKTWGVGEFDYKTKENALGWMNFTIGYIQTFDKKNKKEGAIYMHKVSQGTSQANADPAVYTATAQYYVELLNAEILKLKEMPAVDPADTDEVKKQKDEDLKKQAAIMKGTADRALDAYARAYAKAPVTAAAKPFKDSLLKSFKDIYQIRYDKPEGADAMINTYASKPFLSPTAPIVPVAETALAATTGAAATKPATGPATKPATIPAKNPVTTPVKPATVVKPATAKPGAAVAKKKTTR